MLRTTSHLGSSAVVTLSAAVGFVCGWQSAGTTDGVVLAVAVASAAAVAARQQHHRGEPSRDRDRRAG